MKKFLNSVFPRNFEDRYCYLGNVKSPYDKGSREDLLLKNFVSHVLDPRFKKFWIPSWLYRFVYLSNKEKEQTGLTSRKIKKKLLSEEGLYVYGFVTNRHEGLLKIHGDFKPEVQEIVKKIEKKILDISKGNV